jgi:hypothetical protein
MSLLAHYFQPDQSEGVSSLVAGDWMDALEMFPQDAIEHACKSYLHSQPSRRPTIADIRNRVVAYMDARAKKVPQSAPAQRLAPPPRPSISQETAQRILQEAGFTEERLNLVKRFPSAPGYAAAEAMSEKVVQAHWSEVADQDGPDMAALKAARDANPLVQAARAAQARAAE